MRWPLLILLAAPLALVACGGGSSHNASPPPVKLDPVAYVRHAASHTARAQSEHETLTGTVMAAGHEVTLHGSGDFSNSKGQGSMTATFSAEGMNGSIDEVLDGTTIYMSSPLFSGSLPNGKTWMKLDLAKAYASQGVNFSSLMSQSPEQGLKRLQGAGKVTSVGTDTIDGAETTHFRVTHLDVSKIPQGSKIEALIHAKFGATNVWVDKAHGYVRRMSLSASYSYDGHSASMSLTLDLSRFGEPVHVNLPPASKTFDATGAAIQGLGG